jgi:methyl-accepting chemotaxis protein-1 (serine sensor receptor)
MLNNLSIKSRLIFLTGFLAVQLVVGGVIGLVSLGNANNGMKSIYDDRLVPLGQLDNIIRLLDDNQLNVAKSLVSDPQTTARYMDEVDRNIQEIGKTWDAYMATYLTPEEKKLAD